MPTLPGLPTADADQAPATLARYGRPGNAAPAPAPLNAEQSIFDELVRRSAEQVVAFATVVDKFQRAVGVPLPAYVSGGPFLPLPNLVTHWGLNEMAKRRAETPRGRNDGDASPANTSAYAPAPIAY